MTWVTSTRETIIFISPELNIFSALWKNNERSGEKNLGIFSAPDMNGEIVQDKGRKSVKYPLTVFFEGFNHYTEANKFFKALGDEKGQWEIIHPTKGSLILQLIDYKELIDPVGTGNYTVFETNWIEPANIERLIGPTNFLDQLLNKIIEAMDFITTAIATGQQIRSDLYAAVQSALAMIDKVKGLTDKIMSEYAATQDLINDSWNQAKETLEIMQDEFQAEASDPEVVEDLLDAFFDIITIPLQAGDDYTTRTALYTELIDAIITSAPTETTPEGYNASLFHEFAMVSTLCALCQIIATTNFSTRTEVVNAIDNLSLKFTEVIESLETIQDRFV